MFGTMWCPAGLGRTSSWRVSRVQTVEMPDSGKNRELKCRETWAADATQNSSLLTYKMELLGVSLSVVEKLKGQRVWKLCDSDELHGA